MDKGKYRGARLHGPHGESLSANTQRSGYNNHRRKLEMKLVMITQRAVDEKNHFWWKEKSEHRIMYTEAAKSRSLSGDLSQILAEQNIENLEITFTTLKVCDRFSFPPFFHVLQTHIVSCIFSN